ncbi:MAG: hypothetical protein ACKOS8_09815 [Gemmataceae bacterium]
MKKLILMLAGLAFILGCGEDKKTEPVKNTNMPLPPAPKAAGGGAGAKSAQPSNKVD